MIDFFRCRRGTMFLLPVVIGLVVGLTVFLVLVSHGASKKSSAFLGEKQLVLMSSFERSKQHLLFVDLAAELSSERAVLGLAENAGFEGVSGCGSFLGYNLYNNLSGSCFPDDLGSGFSVFFNSSFSEYSSSYSKFFISPDLYRLSLLSGDGELEVVGFASDFLEFPFFSKGSAGVGEVCPLPADLVPIRDVECVTSSSFCELNKDVVDGLVRAHLVAEGKGYDILVTSARRTFEQQRFLFNLYGPGRASRPSCGSPHVGGRAVDVVLVKGGVPVEGMGSGDGAMDDLGVGKRAELQAIMCEAGFQRFSGEFWHFEYGTARWKDPADNGCVLS